MKIKESGMPSEKIWESFFDPLKIMNTLGLNKNIGDMAEFGCGYGTFTIPAAKMIKGKIFGIDIESEMIETTKRTARERKLDNVKTIQEDLTSKESTLNSESVDYVMIFNILHGEYAENLLKESWRILKINSILGIIHWNYDPNTPRGPPIDIRKKPEELIKIAKSIGFSNPKTYDLKPFHFGIKFTK